MVLDNRELDRQFKKLIGDGSAERQILLLKLQHEFENAPNFRPKYVADADAPEQKWIATIGALLSRVGIDRKVEFQVQKNQTVSYWQFSRDGFRRTLSATIEDLKLELELEGRDQIGQVYEAGKEFDFFTDLKGIIASANTEIFIIDPYFDGNAFGAYLSTTGKGLSVKILCGKHANDVASYGRTFTAQTSVPVAIRKTKLIHDRVIFIDQSDGWIVGSSVKDAGKKPTYLIPLAPQIMPAKLQIYEDVWSQAQNI